MCEHLIVLTLLQSGFNTHWVTVVDSRETYTYIYIYLYTYIRLLIKK